MGGIRGSLKTFTVRAYIGEDVKFAALKLLWCFVTGTLKPRSARVTQRCFISPGWARLQKSVVHGHRFVAAVKPC